MTEGDNWKTAGRNNDFHTGYKELWHERQSQVSVVSYPSFVIQPHPDKAIKAHGRFRSFPDNITQLFWVLIHKVKTEGLAGYSELVDRNP